MSSHGSATLAVDDVPTTEKPQNGVAGLKQRWPPVRLLSAV